MGIALAAMSVFAPTRKRTLATIAPRALIAANFVSLMTASIAGKTDKNRTTILTFNFILMFFFPIQGLLHDDHNA